MESQTPGSLERPIAYAAVARALNAVSWKIAISKKKKKNSWRLARVPKGPTKVRTKSDGEVEDEC